MGKNANSSEKKAYASTIEKVAKANNTEHSKIYFLLVDMDKNGIDELLFTSNTSFDESFPNSYTQFTSRTPDFGVYTYQNGKVKKLIENYPGGGNASEFTYSIKQNRIYYYKEGKEPTYYKIQNGKLKSLSLKGLSFNDIVYDKNVKYYKATLSNIRKYVYKNYKLTKTTAPKVTQIADKRKRNSTGYKEKVILYGKTVDGTTVWKFSSPYTWLTELSTNEYFINQNTIYLFSDKLYALDKSTGKKKWTHNDLLGGVSVAFDKSGNMFYTGYYYKELQCISPNGKLLFKTAIPDPYYWPYKIILTSNKVRVYIEGGTTDYSDSHYLTYTSDGQYLGLDKN